MNYEIVHLNQKTFVGFADVTNNAARDMGQKIGALWQKLYAGVAQNMKSRVNKKAVGLYCDYKQNGDYTVLAGFEVAPNERGDNGGINEQGISVKTIPAGNYAKFTVKGDMVTAVAQAWSDIWATPLERTFTGDFEEYQEDTANGNGTIFIYIAVK